MSGPPLPTIAIANVTPVKNTTTTRIPTHVDLRCLTLLTAPPPWLLASEATGESAGRNLPAEVNENRSSEGFRTAAPTSAEGEARKGRRLDGSAESDLARGVSQGA